MDERQKSHLKLRLQVLAKRKCWCDQEDFSACDYSGGNFDDAYSGGFEDGTATLAQELLETFFPDSP